MNILFLTISGITSINNHGIYTDLLRCFRNFGHSVYVISAREKSTGLPTELCEENGIHVLRIQIGNITKCGVIEKGISTILIGAQYRRAINTFFSTVCFDLIVYSTPPITLAGVVEYIKERDNARTYLLLKDIFPQNAVDLGMLSPRGIKAPLYWYFRRKEERLYSVSDQIGCMSQGNVDYILRHNPEISAKKVEICPNSIEIRSVSLRDDEKKAIRAKFGIPLDKKVFVYGGNLGKPQGVPFIIECLRKVREDTEAFFLIVGGGTEFHKLESFVNEEKPSNVRLIKMLPKDDYDSMLVACDVGMVFLDHRFTIPNFPSRVLSYMQMGLPILACTDPNTDIGKVINEGGFGWWCESNDTIAFAETMKAVLTADCTAMGRCGRKYLEESYTVELSYQTIMSHFRGDYESIAYQRRMRNPQYWQNMH